MPDHIPAGLVKCHLDWKHVHLNVMVVSLFLTSHLQFSLAQTFLKGQFDCNSMRYPDDSHIPLVCAEV